MFSLCKIRSRCKIRGVKCEAACKIRSLSTERRLCPPGLGQDGPWLPVRRLAGCHRPAGRRMRSERSDLLLLSGGAQLCLWRMSCPSRAEARSSSSSGCAFGRGMRSGRVPGCGLEPAPRTLSPRNRVCTFYLSGIRRQAQRTKDPRGASRGHGWKGPWRASQGQRQNKRPPGCKPGADAMQRVDVSPWGHGSSHGPRTPISDVVCGT